MKVKRINYNSTHVPEFRKYMVWLSLFAIGVTLIAVFQAFLLVKANSKGIELSTIEKIVGFGCLIFSLAFILLMIGEISRHIVLIKKIKVSGFIESKTFGFDYTSKFSFGNLFRIFEYIVLIACIIFVVGFTTYSVLNYIYYTTVNYYLPIAMMVLVSTFYATRMLELKYVIEK